MNQLISRLLTRPMVDPGESGSVSNAIGHVNDIVNFSPGDPVAGLGRLITFAIQLVFLVAGLAALLFMLLGAFNWITSEGQKEKVEKAQRMMMNAVIGLVLVVAVFTLFNFFMCNVLAGKVGIGCGFVISVPHL